MDIEESIYGRLESVLYKYSLPVPQPCTRNADNFIKHVCKLVIEQNRNGTPIDLAFVMEILHTFNSMSDDNVEKIQQLLFVSKPTELGLARLCELLRGGGSRHLPVRFHRKTLEILRSILEQDSPPVIKFPGDTKSFVQLPSLALDCSEAYTLTMWCKFNGNPINGDNKLFRARSPHGGVECSFFEYQSDGRCLIRLKAYSEEHRGQIDSNEVHGTVYFTNDKWHLLAFAHKAKTRLEEATVRVYVDGSLEIEHELPYPFLDSPPDSMWTFGAGVRAAVAGMTLYSDTLNAQLLSLLTEAGPYVGSLDVCVSHPQGSFDTGHSVLGTHFTKGVAAVQACRTEVIFSFNPLHFTMDALLPAHSAGKVSPDFIEMTHRLEESDSSKVPFLTGHSDVEVTSSWVTTWMHVGGTGVMMYLIWDYANYRVTGSAATATAELMLSCVFGVMDLLSVLLTRSCAGRDQFLQEHSFHVLALTLGRLENKAVALDVTMANRCIQLLLSMQSDALDGDGIAAALQGLLLDFKLWEFSSMETKQHILSSVAELTATNAHVLFRSTGVQRILDIMNEHCSAAASGLRRNREGGDVHTAVVALADAGHQLLMIAIDAALAYSQSMGSAVFPEMEFLLATLEVTPCCEVAERLLRTITHMRFSAPRALRFALQDTRFSETIAMRLLCDTSVFLSSEVRRVALMTLLWDLQQSLGDLPSKVLQLKQCFPLLSGSAGGTDGSRRYREQREGITQLRQLMRLIEKGWLNTTMLSTEMGRSTGPEGWEYRDKDGNAETVLVTPVEEVLDVLAYDGPLGSIDSIITFPLMAVLLPKAPVVWVQRLLMSMSVMLKTNEAHVAVLSLLPDISWAKILLELALIGETRQGDGAETSPGHAHGRVDELLSLPQHKDGGAEEDWTDVSTFGEVAITSQATDAARTCIELAVDGLSQVLLYKVRHFGPAAWQTFKTIRSCMLTEALAPYRKDLLRRLCVLCLQKLSRSAQGGWHPDVMFCIGKFLSFIEEKKYCGNEVMFRSDLLIPKDVSNLLEGRRQQDCDEKQMMLYVMDLLGSLRRSGEKYNFGVREVRVILPSIRIIVGCMHCIDDDCGDRVCVELLSTLSYISEKWTFFQQEGFKDIVLGVLRQFQHAIDDATLPEPLRERYRSAVVTIVQYFVQLRFTGMGISLSLPQHVVKIVDIVGSAEGLTDTRVIFSKLSPYLSPEHGTETISFEDAEDSMVAVSVGGATDGAPAQGSGGGDEPLLDLQTPHDGYSGTLTSDGDLLPDFGVDDVIYPQLDPFSDDLTGGSDGDRGGEESPVEERKGNGGEGDSNAPVIPRDLPSTETLTAVEEEEVLRQSYFDNWIALRRGIMQDRADSERARLMRTNESIDFSIDATQRYWKSARRKTETELFMDEPSCEWKLGIAHEGYFPSRKRVVLRPRFGDSHRGSKYSYMGAQTVPDMRKSGSMSAEELQMMLLQSLPGVILDVTDASFGEGGGCALDSSGKGGAPPGSGWGMVDADDSEEGYGVVGVATEGEDEQSPPLENEKIAMDSGGDVRAIEEGMRLGRDINTGPAHSGTRRINNDATIQEAEVVLISPSGNYVGVLTFSSKDIFFVSTHEHEGGHLDDVAAVTLLPNRRTRRRKWLLSTVCSVFLRRYRLRDSALEVFFSRGKHRNFFVDFGSSSEDIKRRNRFAKALMHYSPRSAFKHWPGMSTYRLVSENSVQQRWINGELSNFDYLMALNTMAGRSYNDLCQYPVMPWVLAQYDQDTIDLSDPAVYRDLSKPMGALNEERLQSFIERFESFKDGEIPPFMYGSHYSTMVGVVLHFLVRLQPFASLHMNIQNGHFDVPDRLFSSIPRAWEHNTTMLSEVKELTPEWFTLPEFLRNVNGYEFGKMQSNESVGDVELPPWASSPEDFIRINREALESDYVSAHLHEWIDLIFGYKQRGPAAVEAHNVFYYLTYYGAVNRDMISDEATRKAIELQIAHFGQVPMELFRTPHPPKQFFRSVPRPLRKCFEIAAREFVSPTTMEEKLAIDASCTLVNRLSSGRVVDIIIRASNIICVLENGVLESYRYGLSEVAKVIVANGNRETDRRDRRGRGVRHDGPGGDGGEERNVISFDDSEPSVGGNGSKRTDRRQQQQALPDLALELEGGGRASGQSTMRRGPAGSVNGASPMPAHLLHSPQGAAPSVTRDLLLVVDRDTSHFDVVPRVPLSHPRRHQINHEAKGLHTPPTKRASMSDSSSSRPTATDCVKVLSTPTSRLLLTYGRVDGGIAVREVAERSTQVVSGADFRSHRAPVTCVAVDEIIGSHTDVLASCDERGKVLVWTVSRVHSSKGTGGKRSIISRRPQRAFTCFASPDACCDVSWQMGIVVCASMGVVSVFSIERNERLHVHDIHNDVAEIPGTGVGRSYRLWHIQDAVKIRRVLLCDDGLIAMHIEVTQSAHSDGEGDLLGMSQFQPKSSPLITRHFLAVYTLHGIRTGILQLPSPITCLSCPGRGGVIISGHRDGAVFFLCTYTLQLLYEFRPHERCLTCVVSGGGRGSVVVPEPEHAAVLSVRVGPSLQTPSIVCVSTSSGALYVRALPDFIRWDRIRSQSTLAQIVNAPMQAVRGTLQQAQHLGAVATDAAGVLASNAKSFADEALAKVVFCVFVKVKRKSTLVVLFVC